MFPHTNEYNAGEGARDPQEGVGEGGKGTSQTVGSTPGMEKKKKKSATLL